MAQINQDTYSSNTFAGETRRDKNERRKGALKLERMSFIPHYEALSQFISPRRGRYFITDRNRGGDRYTAIINSKATTALRIARSGLQAGCMSPVQRWFRWETDDPDLSDYGPVKNYLFQVERIIYSIMSESNLYDMSAAMFGELLQFATGAMLHVDDFEDVARFYTLTAGSYMIGQDDRQVVNTLIREWEWSTLQIMQKFGPKSKSWARGGRVSQSVQTAYDVGNYDAWFPLTHIIEPNEAFNPGKKLSKFKKFSSCYYEPGNNDKDAVLSEAGFDSFPAYCPRWDVTGEDVYGTDCSAMVALGDIKGLQIQERRKAQAIDKMVQPPMKGPAYMRNVPVDSLPGGMTIYDGDASGKDGLSPLYTVDPKLQEMRMDMTAVESRIDDAFFVKLFRAISDMPGIQPRNQLELNQRDKERMLELGPVLGRVHGEFLKRLCDEIFDQGVRANIFPKPPRELAGKQIRPKFISSLAVAQQAFEAGNIERFTTFIAGLVTGGNQGAAAKLNTNNAVDYYGTVIGVPPTIIVPTKTVLAAQAKAQKQAEQAQQGAAANSAADTAAKGAAAVNKLGSTPTQSGNPMGGDQVLKAISQAVTRRGNPNLFSQPKSLG